MELTVYCWARKYIKFEIPFYYCINNKMLGNLILTSLRCKGYSFNVNKSSNANKNLLNSNKSQLNTNKCQYVIRNSCPLVCKYYSSVTTRNPVVSSRWNDLRCQTLEAIQTENSRKFMNDIVPKGIKLLKDEYSEEFPNIEYIDNPETYVMRNRVLSRTFNTACYVDKYHNPRHTKSKDDIILPVNVTGNLFYDPSGKYDLRDMLKSTYYLTKSLFPRTACVYLDRGHADLRQRLQEEVMKIDSTLYKGDQDLHIGALVHNSHYLGINLITFVPNIDLLIGNDERLIVADSNEYNDKLYRTICGMMSLHPTGIFLTTSTDKFLPLFSKVFNDDKIRKCIIK